MKKLKNTSQYKYILITLIIIIISILRIPNNIQIEKIKNIKGIITYYKIDKEKLSLIIKTNKEKIKCIYYYKDKKDINQIKYGTIVSLEGSLKKPPNNTIPNTFNYNKYLKSINIYKSFTIKKIKSIQKTNNIIYKIKNYISNKINNIDSLGYLQTFILANKNYIDEDIYNNYKTLNIIHIFSISGMHITLLSIILFKILNKINKSKFNYIIIFFFLLFYMILTNYSPSIVRSVIFFIILNTKKVLKLNISTNNILLLSINIILIIFPYFIINTGFIYSSLISYTLIKYSNLIKYNKIFNLIAVSTLSTLISLPISININYEINLLFIISNIIFIPLITLIIYPLSILVLLIPNLYKILLIFLEVIEFISIKLSQIKILTISLPKFNLLSIVLYYIILYLVLTINKKYIVYIIMFLITIKYINYLDPNYYVYFIDVGQGDMTLIKYKDECIIIDTGPENKYLSNSINHFIKSIGINNIDLLIISHGDNDHIGNALDIIEKNKVNSLILNNGDTTSTEKKVRNKIKANNYSSNINIKTINHNIYNNENDNSIINYLSIYNSNFLLMGDASSKVEKELNNKYYLNAEIIKVAHHGSKTSSSNSFLKTIKPKYAIISSGRNNIFNHPSTKTINNLNDNNIKIYNTQTSGTILFKINKNKRTIFEYLP